jgi:hypothetical protein
MSTTVKFDNQPLVSLGIHYSAQSWTVAELMETNEEYVSPDLEFLLKIAALFGIDPEVKILSTFQDKNTHQTYFSLPRIHLTKEGQLAMFMGEIELPLTYAEKAYTTLGNELTFKVNVRRKDPKDKNSEITGVLFNAPFIVKDENDFEEEVTLQLQVKIKKDSDLPAIAKALQAGEVESVADSIVQVGKGGGITPYYKPWMLPKGLYKIDSVGCKHLPNGGKIWQGRLFSVDSNESYPVSMNTSPFITQQRETLLIMAQRGKPVYIYLAGAFEGGKGISAIGHAVALPNETDEVVKQFLTEAKTLCAATASKNANKLLSDADITTRKAEFEANEQARIAEWAAAKATKPANDTIAVEATVESEKEPVAAGKAKKQHF